MPHDKITRVLVVVLCAVALGAGAFIIGSSIHNSQGAATRRAERVAIRVAVQHVAEANKSETAGGCNRSNITKAVYNRQSLGFYLFLQKQGRAVAAASPDPRIRKLARFDTSLAGSQVWQPLIDCNKAISEGVRYRSPAPVFFTRALPPKSALALSSQPAN